ncbi:hypothetical protein CHUAL_001959 [Chamberlinius hualienensis]
MASTPIFAASAAAAVPHSKTAHKIISRTLQDDSIVINAFFCAIEDGNLSGLKELVSSAVFIDFNQNNRHGESGVHVAAGLGHLEILKYLQSMGADLEKLDNHGDSPMYWAARQGHVNIIKYLKEESLVNSDRNKLGESYLHVAARYGHSEVVQYLCTSGFDINMQDQHGETALHIAVWHGFPNIVQALCSAGAKLNIRDKEDETPLHCASARGHMKCVRLLIDAGVDMDLVDKRGCTSLHLAIKRHHTQVAVVLLHAGCQFDIADCHGEMPIHLVAREGLLQLAQNLCAFGCLVDVPNKNGLYPLHIAAKHGWTEVVRCLCLAGCRVDQKNKDGITAEISALAQGYSDVGDLLNRLHNDQIREEYIAQLIPGNQPISRIKLKLFGNSGVGKTTFIDSLKCGYLGSFFRRTRSTSTTNLSSKTGFHNGRPSSPCNSKSTIELGSNHSTYNTSPFTFKSPHTNYTRGIDVQQTSINGVGEISLWEFSGQKPYFMIYDHFVGNVNCIHAVVFNLCDSYDVQLQQILYWLDFIYIRIPIQEPLYYRGKSSAPAKVVLIATHADTVHCSRTTTGELVNGQAERILIEVKKRFQHLLDIHDHIYVVNATTPNGPPMKAFKNHLVEAKSRIVQTLPKSTGFLQSTISHMPAWRCSAQSFPVLSWAQFVDLTHRQVNPLAGDDHMRELIQQLQLMGEVLYLKSDCQDMVVINPKWLCGTIIGQLLSHVHLEQARVTGCYTVDDFQLMFPETDALDLLQVLESLNLCTRCDNDGDIEYEFPCFNLIETLPGLWDKQGVPYTQEAVYGGVKLTAPKDSYQLLDGIFLHLQVQLRRSVQEHHDPDSDLYQWLHGSKFCSGNLESLITLEKDGKAIELKVRGPTDMRKACFYFLEDLLTVVDQVVFEMCPGFLLEKHILSAQQLKKHFKGESTVYTSRMIMEAQWASKTSVQNAINKSEESLADLLCFGSQEILSGSTFGIDLHISSLSLLVRQKLCALLDPPESMGKDWCVLAIQLGMADKLPSLDASGDSVMKAPSCTDRMIQEWSKNQTSTIVSLLDKLKKLGRIDATDLILMTSPLHRTGIYEDDKSVDYHTGSASSGSRNSSCNLSR